MANCAYEPVSKRGVGDRVEEQLADEGDVAALLGEQGHRGGHVAADGVAGHRDAGAVEVLAGPVGDDPPGRGVALLERRRVAGLGRAVVLGEDDGGVGADGELAHQPVVGRGVTEDPSRAVDVDDDGQDAGRARRTDDPHRDAAGRAAGHADPLAVDVGCGDRGRLHVVDRGAALGGRELEEEGRLRGGLDERLGVRVTGFAATKPSGTATNSAVWDLIRWRVLAGIGIGIASVIAPAYIAEISPAAIRGRLGSLQQLAIVTGIFVALLSDAALSDSAGSAADTLWWGLSAWRWMFLVGVVPAVYALLALGIPESPRFLVGRDRNDEAAAVLARLGAGGAEGVEAKVAEIAESLRREKTPSLRDLRGPRAGLQPIVWVGILLSVFQQFVGINVIFYYSTSLWRSVGFSESDSLTITVITSVTNIVVTLVAIAVVDRIGRKPLLIIGSVGMTLTLATMAVCFSQAVGSGEDLALPGAWGTVALVAANLFVVSFGVSWGPVVWVLLGEMFPNYMRAAALSVAAAAQWIANFVVSTTFPVLAATGLTLAYGIYALFALLSGWFVIRAVRETKGRELEDMQATTGLVDATAPKPDTATA